MAGRLALAAFVTLLVAQAGCATRLDFDAVSAGRDAGQDAQVGLDAASEPAREAGALGQADADEAGRPPLDEEHGDKPRDAGASGVVDAATTDSGDSLPDAFTPVNDASLDPALFSCAKLTPAADFCDEFEATDVDLQDAIVIDPQNPAAGSIGRDDRAGAAGRASLLAVVQPQVPTCFHCDLSVCLYSRPFDLSGHKLLTIEFDMRVEEIDRNPDHRAAVFQFYFGSAERGYSQHTLQLQANGDGLETGLIELDRDGDVDGHSGAYSTPISYGWKPMPMWEWVHVKYVLDALDTNASGNKVYVSTRTWSPAAGAEEQVLANASLTYSLRYHNPVFELGFPIVDQQEFAEGETNGSWQARFDNVLVRIEAR